MAHWVFFVLGEWYTWCGRDVVEGESKNGIYTFTCTYGIFTT